MNYKIQYSCLSHSGKLRSHNEDNFACSGICMDWQQKDPVTQMQGTLSLEKPQVLGVFDGIGGEACGETASLLAAKSVLKKELSADGICDLQDMMQKSNASVCLYAKKHQIPLMGTTAALLGFYEEGICLCNVGDSRIYRCHEHVLQQISLDHSASAPYGKKAPLYQYLGMDPCTVQLDPYLAAGSYHDQDVYLLCTDGLSDLLSLEEMAFCIENLPFETAGQVLLDKALEAGGYDNITLILCKVVKEKAKMSPRLFGRAKRK